ncbi:MAG: acyl-CoA dehydrogenase [Rubrivivax sp.]|nr:acyl-CoA dehydrogenase [Rubrivivax sp.]
MTVRAWPADDLHAEALQRLLQDRCPPALVRAIEAGASPAALWADVESSGHADALVAEERGGAGLALEEAYPLLELCGRLALPVPLAATLLGRALLDRAGVAVPPGAGLTIAHAATLDAGGLHAPQVPFGRVAGHVLVQADGAVLLLPAAAAQAGPGVFPLDATLAWPHAVLRDAVRVPGDHDLLVLQACAASALLAGALRAAFEQALAHAQQREQFGRPIGKFQVIQHHLAVLAEHVLAARLAARLGCTAARDGAPDRLRVAMAKARTSEAAVEGAATAHAVHGAIGFTAEYDLQLHTRRLHAWRLLAGSESHWHAVLGGALLDGPHEATLDAARALTDRDTNEEPTA